MRPGLDKTGWLILAVLLAGLSTCLWIASGLAGGILRLLLVYAAGALCTLAIVLFCAELWLLTNRDRENAQEPSQPATAPALALRDPLTGLANQASFEDLLRRAIARARRNRLPLGVLCIDLDHFKRVNDTLGHLVGDGLLRQVAQRLEACLRSTDIVARWGGDEFLVALPELADRQDVFRIAGKLSDALRSPFQVAGHHIAISGTVGISLYPEDGLEYSTLCENADRAMYRAKREDRGTIACYTPELGEIARDRLQLEQHLRTALGKGELVLFYQPLFDLKTRKPVALEALIRWRHPERGVLRPDRFLSIAEDCGLILPIGVWTLDTVCRQIHDMQDSGYAAVRIAVNVSRLQFFRPDFEEAVKRAVRDSGIEPAWLVLELTEDLVMRDFNQSWQKIDRLRKFGVHVSIDDFGTGEASLRLLQRLPIDSLKIDPTFIHDLGASPRSLQLVDSIIRLARGLGVSSVAEGVESIPQLKALRSLGCDKAQGYLFGMPLPAAEIGRWVSRDRVRCALRARSVMPPAKIPVQAAVTEVQPMGRSIPIARGMLGSALSLGR